MEQDRPALRHSFRRLWMVSRANKSATRVTPAWEAYGCNAGGEVEVVIESPSEVGNLHSDAYGWLNRVTLVAIEKPNSKYI